MGNLLSAVYDVSVKNPRGDEVKFLRGYLEKSLTNEGFEVIGNQVHYILSKRSHKVGEIIDCWELKIKIIEGGVYGSEKLRRFAQAYKGPTDEERKKATSERAIAEETRQMNWWLRHGRP